MRGQEGFRCTGKWARHIVFHARDYGAVTRYLSSEWKRMGIKTNRDGRAGRSLAFFRVAEGLLMFAF